jgi:hypothetical protein
LPATRRSGFVAWLEQWLKENRVAWDRYQAQRTEAAPDKKKAPAKGPISLAVVMVVMMMVFTGTGHRRCGNCQREKSCENVGE